MHFAPPQTNGSCRVSARFEQTFDRAACVVYADNEHWTRAFCSDNESDSLLTDELITWNRSRQFILVSCVVQLQIRRKESQKSQMHTKLLITIPQEEINWKLRRNYKFSRWTFYGEAAEFPDWTMSGMTG
jgi:regulation of enolase protein 1 (concanavalin A-like superfamily)